MSFILQIEVLAEIYINTTLKMGALVLSPNGKGRNTPS